MANLRARRSVVLVHLALAVGSPAAWAAQDGALPPALLLASEAEQAWFASPPQRPPYDPQGAQAAALLGGAGAAAAPPNFPGGSGAAAPAAAFPFPDPLAGGDPDLGQSFQRAIAILDRLYVEARNRREAAPQAAADEPLPAQDVTPAAETRGAYWEDVRARALAWVRAQENPQAGEIARDAEAPEAAAAVPAEPAAPLAAQEAEAAAPAPQFEAAASAPQADAPAAPAAAAASVAPTSGSEPAPAGAAAADPVLTETAADAAAPVAAADEPAPYAPPAPPDIDIERSTQRALDMLDRLIPEARRATAERAAAPVAADMQHRASGRQGDDWDDVRQRARAWVQAHGLDVSLEDTPAPTPPGAGEAALPDWAAGEDAPGWQPDIPLDAGQPDAQAAAEPAVDVLLETTPAPVVDVELAAAPALAAEPPLPPAEAPAEAAPAEPVPAPLPADEPMAEAADTAAEFAGETLVAAAELDNLRGGFTAPSGLTFSFGIERAVFINGELQATQTLNLNNLGQVTGSLPATASALGSTLVIQNGPNNTAEIANLGGNAVPLIIQNTLDNQTISTVTTINATVPSLSTLRSIEQMRAITDAINDAATRR